MQRSGRGVVQLRFPHYDAIRTGFAQAAFAFSGMNFGALAIVVIDSVRLLADGRIDHVRRIFVGHGTARMVRVYFYSAYAVGLQL